MKFSLEHLDWDTCNPAYVHPQYPLENLKVDYGLKIWEEGGLRCIIEVKAVGNLQGADPQLFQYAFHAGTPLAVLTDGSLWKFYLPAAAGKYDEKLVRTLDFEKHPPEEIVDVLTRYLSFKNTCSGQANRNATSDHERRIKSIVTGKNISNAWANLLMKPSDKLVTLLIEETSKISEGFAPAKESVEEFLKSVASTHSIALETTERKRKPSESESHPHRKIAGKKGHFVFLGEKYEEKNPTDAFVKIIKTLASRDKTFLSRLAPHIAGRTRKYLTQNYQDFTDSQKGSVVELSMGWYLCFHSSTDQKKMMLQKACEVARIPFGKPSGLKLDF